MVETEKGPYRGLGRHEEGDMQIPGVEGRRLVRLTMGPVDRYRGLCMAAPGVDLPGAVGN